MAVQLYMDVHVPRAITEQLRLRGVDVMTAQEDDATQLTDEQLLDRAAVLSRIVFTHDHRFRAMAEERIREGKHFCGLAFGPMSASLIGIYIADLAPHRTGLVIRRLAGPRRVSSFVIPH